MSNGEVFGSCTFFVALATATANDAGAQREQLRDAIRASGGMCEDRFQPSVTHVVAVRDMRDVQEMGMTLVKAVTSGRTKVVSSAWVHACLVARQLINPAKHPVLDYRFCFKGVVATISQVRLLLVVPMLIQSASMPAVWR